MLNFVFVGVGEESEIKKMLTDIRIEFNKFFRDNNANIYNLDTLSKGESDVAFLEKKQSLRFSTKKSSIMEYWGVLDCENFDELQSKWFSSLPIEFSKENDIYYSKNNLFRLLEKAVKSKNKDCISDICDFVIDYRLDFSSDGNLCCIVEFRLFSESFLNEKGFVQLFDWYKQIICNCAEKFPQVFSSAYISNNEVGSISHINVYEKFDFNLLNSHILGIEYAFYASDEIFSKVDISKISNYSIEKNINGVFCTAKCEFDNYNQSHREIAENVCSNIIIPAYTDINWSGLCASNKTFSKFPETISVYFDTSMTDDPYIIFSYGLTVQQLNKMVKEIETDWVKCELMDRFSITQGTVL